jgi:ribonucleoside-diphosphate reductase alpha chain
MSKLIVSKNGIQVLQRQKYLWPKEDGSIETPDEMFLRVATFVGNNNLNKLDNKDTPEIIDVYYQLMSYGQFIPNTPTLLNAGKPNAQLSACFVLPIDDSIDSIYTTLANTAKIVASGGGVGFSGARLRSKGSPVGKNGKISDGNIPFIKLFNFSSREVLIQGSARKGAHIWVLPVWHPDIEDFIDLKKDPSNDISQFNISVGITDAFMQAVMSDADWELIDPITNKIKVVKAMELYNKIIDSAWTTGDPGCIFLDTLNQCNPTPDIGTYEGVNPCVVGSAKLLTDNGYRTFEELWERNGKVDHNTADMSVMVNRVVNSHGIVDATCVYKTSDKASVYETTFNNGQKIKTTSNHTFIKTNGQRVKLSELNIGDQVNQLSIDYIEGTFDYPEYAILAGWVIGDGTVTKCGDNNQYQRAYINIWDNDINEIGSILQDLTRAVYYKSTNSTLQSLRKDPPEGRSFDSFNYQRATINSMVLGRLLCEDGIQPYGHKHSIPSSIWNGNSKTIAGFIKGIFSADGSPQVNEKKKSISIRLWHNSFNPMILGDIQLLLLQLGIKSTLHFNRKPAGKKLMNNGNGGVKEYNCKPGHELIISGIKHCSLFMERVGFLQESKNKIVQEWLLQHHGSNNSNIPLTTTVKSIEYVGEEPTYCLTEPGSNEIIVNGIIIGNCAEQALLPYESCNLGHINLSKFVFEHPDLDWTNCIDWESLSYTVRYAVQFLDDVIEVNYYVLPEIEQAQRYGNRKIGLGVLGFADLLIKLGIPYGSDLSIQVIDKLASFINLTATQASIDLGKLRGPFQNINKSIYNDGRRNASITTIAPTGTTSIILGCSSGIEPIYALSMTRKQAETTMDEFNPLFESWLHNTYDNHDIQTIKEYIKQNGTIVGCPNVNTSDQCLWLQANEISWDKHVETQAVWQSYIDSGISKTINMPETATREDIKNAYQMAWQLGCKGITVYRNNCRVNQVLSVKQDKPEPVAKSSIIQHDRNKVTYGSARKIKTGCGNAFIFIGSGDNNTIHDIMGRLGKSGGCAAAWWEALCRVTSLASRYGVPSEEIIKQLSGISCHLPVRHNECQVLSCADALSKAMLEYMNNNNTDQITITNKKHVGACPECQGSNLQYKDGCMNCIDCNFTRC